MASQFLYPYGRRLPLEVVELIIDSTDVIEDDWARRATLYSCALTCRAWLQRSRYNLYRRILLHNRQTLENIERTLSVPGLVPYTSRNRELHLTERYLLPYPLPPSLRQREAPFVHITPLKLTNLAPSLESLKISSVKWHKTPIHPSFFLSTAIFSAVTRLTLDNCRFATFSELQRLVCELPIVSALRLDSCVWSAVGSWRRKHHAGRPHLHCLEICDVADSGTVVNWLLESSCRESLRTLSITSRSYGFIHPVERNSFPQLVSILGHALVSLNMTLPVEPQFAADVDMRKLNKLQSLTIRLSLRTAGVLYNLSAVMRQMTMLSVRRLELEFAENRNTPHEFFHDTPGWFDLDQVFANGYFPSLEVVSITYLSCGPMTSLYHIDHPKLSVAREVVAKRLPLLHSRGLVSLNFGYIKW